MEQTASTLPADPFYSKENMSFLREGAAALDAGKGVEHELIEVEPSYNA